jgi:lipopolysaccharide/colanic/teichoic acid biosynthesis glycosyltransferase
MKIKDGFYKIGKRLIDIILGSIIIVSTLPILILAIILISLDSPGSPIFFQKRIGLNGKPFTIFKLRGMYKNAKEQYPDLYDYSKQESLDFYFHQSNDPRVTRVGKFIRKASIDELPNFINVLLGSMSLVGPRPEIPEVLRLYGKNEALYLSVKPGVTCWSKCTGRDSLTKEETMLIDLDYVKNQSLLVDFKILFKTFISVLGLKNVY